jgi:hypothetical protein
MFSLDALFCYVDDFCQAFEGQWHKKLLNHGGIKRNRAKSLSNQMEWLLPQSA